MHGPLNVKYVLSIEQIYLLS